MADEELSEGAKAVAGAALEVFKDSLKGYVENQEVDDFAKVRIDQYAQEWWSAENAGNDAEKQEHEGNLKHLIAQARGEARRLQIGIATEAKDAIGRALEMAGNFLLKVVPKVLAALI